MPHQRHKRAGTLVRAVMQEWAILMLKMLPLDPRLEHLPRLILYEPKRRLLPLMLLRKTVHLKCPIGELITVESDRLNNVTRVISTIIAKKMISKGCEAFLAYILDT
ncbi:hypothetical protein EPI10_020795 [Gossypium australe]|uniref:Uncharacterized protein n=1 Tax=Gossypium australe TaxID=47621 RepID=A0A5B6WGW6_9ROSI|nr:hypothetical protein EPI10_020795 [Gossypium australe]